MFEHIRKKAYLLSTLLLAATLLGACGGGTNTISAQNPANTDTPTPDTGEPGTGNPDTGTPGTGDQPYTPTIAINNLNPSDYQVDSLQEGKQVYIDRTVVFTSIPQSYTGVDYIRTSNDDKTFTGSSLISFSVDIEVTIYIGFDARISSQPTWLADWTTTSDAIITDDTTLNIYKKNFPAGIITLGGNQGTSGSSMYTIAVAQQENTNDTSPPPSVTGSATVSWAPPTSNTDGTPLNDLAGFKIYYGTVQGNYPNSITIADSSRTTQQINNLAPGTYYFVVSAFDNAGNESSYSNVASKTIF